MLQFVLSQINMRVPQKPVLSFTIRVRTVNWIPQIRHTLLKVRQMLLGLAFHLSTIFMMAESSIVFLLVQVMAPIER